MPKKFLTRKDVVTLLDLASEEICDFDCGEVCASKNRNKVPYCCDDDKVIPVLYRGELEYFQKRSQLWREFKPRTKHERKLVNELEDHNVMARCKGPAKCERDHRGFVCRSFPTYPWFGRNDRVTGLYFSRTLNGKCVLIDRPELIRKKYIRNQIRFWNYLLDRVDGEREFYRDFAASSKKRLTSHGKEFIVLKP